MPDPIETTAAAVHDAWMATKLAAGVTSRQSEDGEELMVPYDQLSEQAKDLDRATVRAVFDAAPTEALEDLLARRRAGEPS
jgi:hypothetical protein